MPPTQQEKRAQHKALRLHGTIARDLGIAVVSGRIRPGHTMKGEILASQGLNVSRTAYREAIRILAAKGLVSSRPKIGTRVSPEEQWHLLDPDVLSWIFQSEPREELLTSLFEMRRIIEPESAALAAVRRSNAQLAQMESALAGMAEHSLAVELGQRADQEFHAWLLRASGNVFLASLISGVAAAVKWTTIFKQRSSPLPRDPLPDHVAVFEAVAARNAEAARAAMLNLIELAVADTSKFRDQRLRRKGKSSRLSSKTGGAALQLKGG